MLLGLYLVLDRPGIARPVRDGLVVGLTSAGLILTRTFYLPALLVGAPLAFFSRYRRWSVIVPTAIAVGIAAAALIGHRFALFERYGDPFWDTAGYARWCANVEKFVLERSLPHPELFPSLAEYARGGPYSGPRISFFDYVFRIHSLPDFLTGSLLGYADIFVKLGGFALPIQSALAAQIGALVDFFTRSFGALGIVVMIATSRGRLRNLLLPAMLLSSLAFSAYLFHLRLLETYRNTMPVYPFVLIAGAWVGEQGVRRLLAHNWTLTRKAIRTFARRWAGCSGKWPPTRRNLLIRCVRSF